MNSFFSRYLWCVAGAAGFLYLAFAAAPPRDDDDQMHVHEFGRLPAVHEGRLKPLDSFAINTLNIVSSRETFRDYKKDAEGNGTEELGPEQPAVRWLLDGLTSGYGNEKVGETHPVFRVDNGDLVEFLDLKLKPEFQRYSIREMGRRWDALRNRAERAKAKARQGKELELFDQKLMALAEHLSLYAELTRLNSPLLVPPQAPGEDWKSLKQAMGDAKLFKIESPALLKALELTPRPNDPYFGSNEFGPALVDILAKSESAKAKDADRAEAEKKAAAQGRGLTADEEKDLTPTDDERKALEQSEGPGFKALLKEDSDFLALRRLPGGVKPADCAPQYQDMLSLWTMLRAYKQNDVKTFNAELADYRARLDGRMPDKMRKSDFETFFNHFAPFYHCAVLYVLVFLLTVFSWTVFKRQLNLAALALAVLTFVVHTFALGARMYILDRPLVFVINLYSTAIFIGWVCLIIGLVLEMIYRNGIGLFAASVIGFVTMVIAHNLAAGDTLEMMRAVLDTNFWLATHVTTVNIGYAATMFAGVLGAAFIFLGVATTQLNRPMVKMLGDIIYGVVCFATLMSFIGTVLGGIWADQSWGRFWGWDPKENGALLIVIWNALILHARWGGLVKQRGMAVLTLFGNIVTIWSWFGVNQLGVGLHSYGFTSGTVFWCVTAVFIHLAVLLVGALIPTSLWMSHAAMTAPAAAAAPFALPAAAESTAGRPATGTTTGRRRGRRRGRV
jgi:ABC-type transport system involved in cytochrome c biogenesis permease subunit